MSKVEKNLRQASCREINQATGIKVELLDQMSSNDPNRNLTESQN